jgi:hypothetical protein
MKTAILTPLLAISMIATNIATVYGMDIAAASTDVRLMGRTAEKDGSLTMAFSGVELEVKFTGSKSVYLRGEVLSNHGFYNLYVDGVAQPVLEIISGKFNVKLADNLDPKLAHTIRLVRRTEAWQGIVRVDGFSLDDGAKMLSPDPLPARKILAIGDSITCGELIELSDASQVGNGTTNAELSYEFLLAKYFNAQVAIVAYGGKGIVRDWRGTNTQMLKDMAAEGCISNPKEIPKAPDFFERALPDDPTLTWDHSKYVPDLVIICLGQNDFSGVSLPISEYVESYIKFIDRVHEVYPKAPILVLSSPMAEMSRDDGWMPRGIALERAITLVDQHYIRMGTPFVMPLFVRHQPGTSLNAHPTAAQHAAMAEEMKPIIEFLTNWKGN